MLLMKIYDIISEAEGKQQNVQAEGRNRRVLGDIGNFVKAVEAGKPKNQIKTNRPMTRLIIFHFSSIIFGYFFRKVCFKFDKVLVIFLGVYVHN